MMKKYLILAVGILFLIFVTLIILQSALNNKPSGQSYFTPTPTPIAGKRGRNNQGEASTTSTRSFGQSSSSISLSKDDLLKKAEQKPEQLSFNELKQLRDILDTTLPYETKEFNLDHSARLDKYVVHAKAENGLSVFDSWLEKNSHYKPVLAADQVIRSKQSISELHQALDIAEKNKLSPEQQAKKDADTFLSLLNSLLNGPQIVSSTISSVSSLPNTPTPSPLPTLANSSSSQSSSFESSSFESSSSESSSSVSSLSPSPPQGTGSFKYYSQQKYLNPLPDGCTIRKAGCGPTSVAMILASYVDSSIDPPKAVELIHPKSIAMGLPMGCDGVYLSPIYGYLKSRSDLQVSDFILQSKETVSAQEAVRLFKGYINSGWTIFVLANFKVGSGGHYFWVTDISPSGEILAYDPWYGTDRPTPFNENQYAPAPYYRYAFAVKKR